MASQTGCRLSLVCIHVVTQITRIDYDLAKRATTLDERWLDMAWAGEVFADLHLTIEGDRQDRCEPRYIALGHLDGHMAVLAWTPRGSARRVMSMKKAR